MIVPLQDTLREISKEEQEKMYFEDIIFNTHKWIEFHEGYYRCEFCAAHHTSVTPIHYTTICPENPYINKSKKEQ
jgi:hypothetical protein